jgi:hypothetical protein
MRTLLVSHSSKGKLKIEKSLIRMLGEKSSTAAIKYYKWYAPALRMPSIVSNRELKISRCGQIYHSSQFYHLAYFLMNNVGLIPSMQ